MRLSVLDQSPDLRGLDRRPGAAQHARPRAAGRRLGYHRYWVAEHHGGPMLAGPSPEALIGPIAAATERIRVGSGGVMLPHYSPLKVAETFSLLAACSPGASTSALGRAPGTDPLTTLRAPARPPPGRARRLPPAARRAARLPRRHAARRPSVRAARRALPGPPRAPGAVAARLLAAERDLGRRSSACPTRSPTSSTPAAPRSPSSTASASRRRRTPAATRGRRRVGDLRRHRRGGRSAWPPAAA